MQCHGATAVTVCALTPPPPTCVACSDVDRRAREAAGAGQQGLDDDPVLRALAHDLHVCRQAHGDLDPRLSMCVAWRCVAWH